MQGQKPYEYWSGEIHTDPISLGLRIKSLRDHLRLTQKEFADLIGVAQSDVSAWEKGGHSRHPSAGALILLGNLSHPGDAVWFWRIAGINPESILAAVGHYMKERGVAPEPLQSEVIPELTRQEWEVSIETAARITGLRLPTIVELIKSGEIKGRKVGDGYVVEWVSAALYTRNKEQISKARRAKHKKRRK